ncbi:MAG: hypothetical protein EPO08_14470 [Rhodospirillaceae bacterium]|nr:MAG: hypothetical protein EPO08_14470 [Rhodospirillaceae bacterium]
MTRRAPHIVCYAPYTNWSIHSARQVTILQALRLRGCSVTYVACDGVYPVCDMTQPANGAALEAGLQACLVCQSSTAARLAAWGMPYRWLGRWLRSDDFKAARAWIGTLSPARFTAARYEITATDIGGEVWEIGAWVKSSVHTHLRHNVLDLDNPEVAEVYAQYLQSGLLACFGLSRLFAQEKPDVQLLFNGRMSSTRVALELAKLRGIRTLCEERSVVAGRMTLFDNAHCLDLSGVDALWQDWKGVPLTPEETAETAAILEDRWRGHSTDVSAFSKGLDDERQARAHLGLAGDKPIWVLFTSSLDESVDEPRSTGVYPTQAAWIEATVAFARTHGDIQLVIRVHPNSGGPRSLGRNPQDEAFFEALARSLPDNVRLVPAADDTSSYTLAAMADLGLIWYSTIGVEMMAMGRPVIRAGASWLAYCDFFTAADGPEGYIASLDTARRAPPQATMAQITGAWRFTYLWYFRQSIPFPLVNQPTWFQGEPAYKSTDALVPGKDPSLDHICNVFMAHAPLYPNAAQRSATVGAHEATAIGRHIAPFRADTGAGP